jgi:hypothetical protein
MVQIYLLPEMSPILMHYHLGNRRFRFIVALYRDRYICAPSRKVKGKVVYSIVRQVQAAGGRFLVRRKYCNHGELWTPVTPSVAREKVSHALRDKYPPDSQGSVYCRLKTYITNLSLLFGLKDDDVYDLITSFILCTDLPRMEHASDNYIKEILFHKIAQLLKSHAVMLHKLILNLEDSNNNKLATSTNSKTYVKIQEPCDNSSVDFMIIKEPLKSCYYDSSVDYQSQSISKVPATCSTSLFSFFIESDDELQIAFDEKNEDHVYHEFPYVKFSIEDLPESFSEKDCEDLIATL